MKEAGKSNRGGKGIENCLEKGRDLCVVTGNREQGTVSTLYQTVERVCAARKKKGKRVVWQKQVGKKNGGQCRVHIKRGRGVNTRVMNMGRKTKRTSRGEGGVGRFQMKSGKKLCWEQNRLQRRSAGARSFEIQGKGGLFLCAAKGGRKTNRKPG